MRRRRCLWTSLALWTLAACARGADPADLGGPSSPDASPLPSGTSSSDAAPPADGEAGTCDDPPCDGACAPGLAPCGGGCCGKLDGVTAGEAHTCARMNAGAVKCWGDNTYGQLGDNSPTLTPSYVPVTATGLGAGIAAIATGSFHSCAIDTSGAAKCWGFNQFGQVGNAGKSTAAKSPVSVTGLGLGVAAMTGGYTHTCARTGPGGAKCWGGNSYGKLGNDSTVESSIPVDVFALSSGVTALATGSYHGCAVVSGGVRCWGLNDRGQLGTGAAGGERHSPSDVVGLTSGVAAVAGGGSHTCALMIGGGVKCWGLNYEGQLGDGTTADSPLPVDVTGLTGVALIAAGQNHTCAVTSAGRAKCWGSNAKGQLGTGSTTGSMVPVDVTGLGSGIAAITAGKAHSCAVTKGGSAKCWGDNVKGQLGDGTNDDRLLPVDVLGL